MVSNIIYFKDNAIKKNHKDKVYLILIPKKQDINKNYIIYNIFNSNLTTICQRFFLSILLISNNKSTKYKIINPLFNLNRQQVNE